MTVVVNIKPNEWPEPKGVVEGQGDLANPGDTSLESVNAFNKRDTVPVTEIKAIDRDDLPGPDQGPPEGQGLITGNDARIGPIGKEAWKAPAYFREEPRQRDTDLSEIVPKTNPDNPVPTV